MLSNFCPVICTSRLEESRDFYTKLLGFDVTHESEWQVDLNRPGKLPCELALIDHSHPGLPQAQRSPVRVVRISLEVDGGGEELERIVMCAGQDAQPALQADESEKKELVITDPNGIRIHLVTPK